MIKNMKMAPSQTPLSQHLLIVDNQEAQRPKFMSTAFTIRPQRYLNPARSVNRTTNEKRDGSLGRISNIKSQILDQSQISDNSYSLVRNSMRKQQKFAKQQFGMLMMHKQMATPSTMKTVSGAMSLSLSKKQTVDSSDRKKHVADQEKNFSLLQDYLNTGMTTLQKK